MTATTRADITIAREPGAIGATIEGLDLTRPIDDASFAQVRTAFLEHLVICVRGQQAMSPLDQLEFAAQWGEISVHPSSPCIPDYPGITSLRDAPPVTPRWQADTTFAARPPSVGLLLARSVPARGAQTWFASGYAAYEGLSAGLRTTLEPLRAIHRDTAAGDGSTRRVGVAHSHPVVRTHPDTRRRALFVSEGRVSHFEGWSGAESASLLSYLYGQVGRPEHTYRHQWQEGDLVIWDNRCAMHSTAPDHPLSGGELHCVTIAGDVPV